MKFKRAALLLASLLLVQSLSACSSSESPAETQSSTQSAGSETSQTEAQTAETTEDEYAYVRSLTESKLDGSAVSFICINDGTDNMILNEIGVENENGVKLNDAVYKRNSMIEEIYDCAIKYSAYDDSATINSTVKNDVLSGDGTYDVIDNNSYSMPGLISSGYLLELSSIPYIDLSQPWWDSDANDNFSIAGQNYVLISSLNHFANAVSWCVMYNKYLAEGYDLGDLYSIASNGEWTLDKMSEMMKNVPMDSNGNGENDSEDMFGCMGQAFDTMALFVGFGCTYFEKDEDDLPKLVIDSEENTVRFNKLFEFMSDSTQVCIVNNYSSQYDNVWSDLWCKGFKDNRALFMFNALVNLMDFSDMDKDFGLLPMPKYDEVRGLHPVTSFCSPPRSCIDRHSSSEDDRLILEACRYSL